MCRYGICSFCTLKRTMTRKSSNLMSKIETHLLGKEEQITPEERLENYLKERRK